MLESNCARLVYRPCYAAKQPLCNGSTESISSAMFMRVCDAAIQAGGTKECLAVVSDWPLPDL